MKAKKTDMEKEIAPDNSNVCYNRGLRKEREKKEQTQESEDRDDGPRSR